LPKNVRSVPRKLAFTTEHHVQEETAGLGKDADQQCYKNMNEIGSALPAFQLCEVQH